MPLALLALTFAQLGAPDAVAARVDDYLRRANAFGFSGSALVAIGDDVVLSKGYGCADRKSGASCSPETLFDLGSLSKQFTASTVLVLQQRKLLSVGDKLSRFFDDVPKDKREITLHQLLTHTAGLPRGLPSVGSSTQSREDFLRATFAAPLESPPGSKHAYSNLGYDLLAAVVERASGKAFEEVVREFVFEPAQLTSTGFRQDGRLDGARAARGEPKPYDPPPPGSLIESDSTRFEGRFDEKLLATEGWYSWGLRGAGGVLSTTLDLWRWERALRGTSVLDEDSLRALFKPGLGDYAYGWYVLDSPRKTPWIAHGGSTGNGFDVYATRYPTERVYFCVLGNTSGLVPWVNLNIGKLIFGEKIELPPAAVALGESELAAHEGEYGRDKLSVRVGVFDGAWTIEALDEGSFEWLAGEALARDPEIGGRSKKIVSGFAAADFRALHAAADKRHALSFMESWWKQLIEHHGALRDARVLGVTADRGGSSTALARLEFERGTELMSLIWSGKTLAGVNIGPPYPSRRRFVPLTPHAGVVHDLVSAKTFATARFDGGALELEVGERKVRLRKK